jgi:hypothetical protein
MVRNDFFGGSFPGGRVIPLFLIPPQSASFIPLSLPILNSLELNTISFLRKQSKKIGSSDCGFLGCDIVQFCRWIQTFRESTRSPSLGLTLKIEASYSFETLVYTYNNTYLFWRNIFSMRISSDIRRADLHIILPLILIFTCLLRPKDLDFLTGNSDVLFLSRMYWKKEASSSGKIFSNSFWFSNNIAELSQQNYFLFSLCQRNGGPDISVSTVSRLDNWGIRVDFWKGQEIFLFITESRPDPGPT